MKYLESSFKIESEHPGSITVIFMEFDDHKKLYDQRKRFNVHEEEQIITNVWKKSDKSKYFKLAIKYNFNMDSRIDIKNFMIIKYLV